MTSSLRRRRTITDWLGMTSRASRSDGNLRWAPGIPFLSDFLGFWPDESSTHGDTVASRREQPVALTEQRSQDDDSGGVAGCASRAAHAADTP